MNINIIEVLTPLSIYHGCSTHKTFWEENFTPGEFTSVNMKNCVCHNVRNHRDIRNGDKYITLEIYLNFGSLNKMKLTSSEPKYYLGISGRGVYYLSGSQYQCEFKEKKGKV